MGGVCVCCESDAENKNCPQSTVEDRDQQKCLRKEKTMLVLELKMVRRFILFL